MNIAIVLAGGVGARVGAKVPKQFIEVLGKPIMIYTLEVFENNPSIDEIILVCVESHLAMAEELCLRFGITKVKTIIRGGKEFVDSCMNGMRTLEGKASSNDIVIVTSADRPFITDYEINDSIRVCKEHGSGVAARKCTLCMFRVEKELNHSHEYLRNTLVQTATPWAFRYGLIKDAFERYNKGLLPFCEDYPIAIFAAAGNEVFFSKSDPCNFKITEKKDINLMEQLLLERKGF